MSSYLGIEMFDECCLIFLVSGVILTDSLLFGDIVISDIQGTGLDIEYFSITLPFTMSSMILLARSWE